MPRARSAEHRLEQVLEVAALGRGPGTLGAAGGRGRLDRDEPLLERLEAVGHLLAELVHRGVEPGRVEQERELGRVAIEVALEHRADPADRAVALRLVEQLVDHRAQRAAVAEELLERARQPAVAVGEVGAERLLERLGGLLVDLFGLADELLELGADDVDVDGDARVLEREQADAQGALDERPRSAAGRSARNAARAGSWTARPSTRMRSPSRRTRVRPVGTSDGGDGSDRQGRCFHDPNGGPCP